MNLILSYLKQLVLILCSSIILFAFLLFPSAAFSNISEFSPDLSEAINDFSDNYCLAISNGTNAENAAEIASRQMITGLIFSGLLKEVKLVPKDELANSVAMKIFDVCGDKIRISEQELNDYLVELADSNSNETPLKPFKPFGLG